MSFGVLPVSVETIGEFDWQECANGWHHETQHQKSYAEQEPLGSTHHLGQLRDSTEDHHDREKRQAHRLDVSPEPAFSRPAAQQIGEPVVNEHTRVPDDEAHYSKNESPHRNHD